MPNRIASHVIPKIPIALARKQPCDDSNSNAASRPRVGKPSRLLTQRPAFANATQRQNAEAHPRMNHVLQALQRRFRLSTDLLDFFKDDFRVLLVTIGHRKAIVVQEIVQRCGVLITAPRRSGRDDRGKKHTRQRCVYSGFQEEYPMETPAAM